MMDPTYAYVCEMDYPLASIRRFGDALALITETIEEPGASAMNEIVYALLDRVKELDKIHEKLFRTHHPSRERFEREGREGWSSEQQTVGPASA
jgi:hypothetical protein